MTNLALSEQEIADAYIYILDRYLVIRQEKLNARGVIDNKCGVVVNLNAVESILEASGESPVNLKFIFEGEEESGSPSMEPFVKANKDLLRADLLVSSDGGSYDKDLPKVFSSLRGLVSA